VPTKRARGRNVFGLLLLDKPVGLSSNQALQRAKRLFDAAKAGHSGSLDPLASGMLPICFGSATRLCGFLLDSHKTYRVTARLGVATTTGDAEGEVVEDRSTADAPLAETVVAALRSFLGPIQQVPPMYSALKRDGVPLYRLARRGIEVERQARSVVIDALSLEEFCWPDLRFVVRCSKGTYVRTLVEDVAIAAGTVGHVTALRRLSVEPFAESQMLSPEVLEERLRDGGLAALDELLVPPDRALPGWATVHLPPAAAERLRHGQAIGPDAAWTPGPVKVYAEAGEFFALAEVTPDRRLVPQRVFLR
jgi:tRNA pseudouridine55 synthase